jgi:hypothetical protein
MNYGSRELQLSRRAFPSSLLNSQHVYCIFGCHVIFVLPGCDSVEDMVD